MSENARDLARAVGGDEARALAWLARAIPVEVREYHADVDDLRLVSEAAAAYFPARDTIRIRTVDRIGRDADMPYLSVLAHEGLHATQARTVPRRGAPIEVLQCLPREYAEPWLSVEEAVAYRATYLLGVELGFDWSGAKERYDYLARWLPEEVRVYAEDHADRAVAWLIEHAARVDARPFDDDLKRMAAR